MNSVLLLLNFVTPVLFRLFIQIALHQITLQAFLQLIHLAILLVNTVSLALLSVVHLIIFILVDHIVILLQNVFQLTILNQIIQYSINFLSLTLHLVLLLLVILQVAIHLIT